MTQPQYPDPLDDNAIDAYLVALAEQQHRGAPPVEPERLRSNWDAITIEIDAPRPRRLERLLGALGVPEQVGRILVGTPALRRSWFIGMTLAMLVAFGAAGNANDASALGTFLALAPMIPTFGVALAYGPGVDPTHEMVVATPADGFRLILVRTVAVLAFSLVVIGLVALFLPPLSLSAPMWLVPSLSLSALCLLLTTWLRPRVAAAILASVWIPAVLISVNGVDPLALFRAVPLTVLGLVGFVSIALAVVRRRRFDLLGVGG